MVLNIRIEHDRGAFLPGLHRFTEEMLHSPGSGLCASTYQYSKTRAWLSSDVLALRMAAQRQMVLRQTTAQLWQVRQDQRIQGKDAQQCNFSDWKGH